MKSMSEQEVYHPDDVGLELKPLKEQLKRSMEKFRSNNDLMEQRVKQAFDDVVESHQNESYEISV